MLLPILMLAQAAAAPMTPGMQMPEPVCVRAGDLPAAFGKWNGTPASQLAIGTPFVVTGAAAAPDSKHPGKVADVPFTVESAGVYRVGLSDAAWVDVMADGKASKTAAHGHGPACTGLRKIVDFELSPGTYTLHLDGMKADTIKAMIVPR